MAFDLDNEELKATRKMHNQDDGLYEDNMNEEDKIEDEEIKEFFEFLKVASDTCKEKGKHYEFVCPLCGNKAQAIRNTYNGHLWAKCSNCDMNVIQ